MKTKNLLPLLLFPVVLVAGAEPGSTSATDGSEPIVFSPEIQRAFDRSGKHLSRSKSAAGDHIDHNGSHQMVTVARIGADGEIETLCTGDEAAAKAFMQGAASVRDNRSTGGRGQVQK